jgi:hypothetical protein
MAQYIDKAAASSACNTQRAYGTMQIIQQLPAAKVVDREKFNAAANEIGESDEWTDCDKMMLAVFVNELEEKLFGGEIKCKQ